MNVPSDHEVKPRSSALTPQAATLIGDAATAAAAEPRFTRRAGVGGGGGAEAHRRGGPNRGAAADRGRARMDRRCGRIAWPLAGSARAVGCKPVAAAGAAAMRAASVAGRGPTAAQAPGLVVVMALVTPAHTTSEGPSACGGGGGGSAREARPMPGGGRLAGEGGFNATAGRLAAVGGPRGRV
jgi:hypothetical protein